MGLKVKVQQLQGLEGGRKAQTTCLTDSLIFDKINKKPRRKSRETFLGFLAKALYIVANLSFAMTVQFR